MPFSVRCYIFGLVAVAVSVIATLPLSKTPLVLLSALCTLVVATERLSRVRISATGWTMSVSLVVTVITVLVLAPPAAALVGLITSFTLPRLPTWTWPKQIVNSAMMSLVPASGSAVCYATGGHFRHHFLTFPAFLWPFAAAVTTSLVVNGLIIAGYVGLTSHTRFVDALRGDVRRIGMPYYSSGVLALIFLSLWDDIGWYTAPLVVVPMYIAHWSLSQYAKEEAAHEGTIAALVQAVEIKDSYTRGHSERVARGAAMLAEQLKMPQDRRAMLRFAGLLHDIGKLGVPTRLLTSTGGLTEEEFKLLCMHPNHGVAVLRDIRFLTEVYEGVLYHHERLDGRGYPTGKSGEEIPEFARIIGVADAFDAMTSTRSYRAARSVEEAVAELRRGAGTQFDPDLVRAFEAALAFAERSGNAWVPTELAPAEPRTDDETAAAATGPWPLPKRVPGFSFADHDDPFVPVEWFSDWYPSWLAHGGEPAAEGGVLLGGIPGQRVSEPEGGEGGEGDGDLDGDLDDGWSERMHSAVVREAGPEPDEGWAWPEDADEETAEQAGAAELEAGARTDGAEEPGSEATEDGSRSAGSDGDSLLRHGAGPGAEPEPRASIAPVADDEPATDDQPPTAEESTRWPVDPGLHGSPRGSMRVRSATPAADPDPRGPDSAQQSATGPDASPVPASGSASQRESGSEAIRDSSPVRVRGAASSRGAGSEGSPGASPARVNGATPTADFDLRKPVAACQDPADPADAGLEAATALDTVTTLAADTTLAIDTTGTAAVPRPKPGDPEAWPPSPEPWEAPEPSADASKAADSAESRPGPSTGPSWFSRGVPGSSPTLHFFGSGDAGPWPPRDPDAKDSEESPA